MRLWIYQNMRGKRKKLKGINKVQAFLEKPSLEKAREYFEDGNYLWNAGMFL